MQGLALHVTDVVVDETSGGVTFSVSMGIIDTQPPSDSDGEMFNQRFGQEILRQLIDHMRR
jgi:hypothetical protein